MENLDAKNDAPISDERRAEFLRRCAQIDAGEVELIDGDQALKEAFEALE